MEEHSNNKDCDHEHEESLVCDSKCHAVCEQVYLEQSALPTTVSRVGQEVVWTLRATNVGGRRINRPLVVSSSFFGTHLLSQQGLAPGETITIMVRTILDEEDLRSEEITSVAFIAYGIPTGTPGRFNVGERISPIVVTSVQVLLPKLDVGGNIRQVLTPGGGEITMNLTLRNDGVSDITFFEASLTNIFGICGSLSIPLFGSPFRIIGTGGTGLGPILTLRNNRTIRVGERVTVTVEGSMCREFCEDLRDPCILDYRFAADQSAIRSGSVRLPILPNPDAPTTYFLQFGSGSLKGPADASQLEYFLIGGGGAGGAGAGLDSGGGGGGRGATVNGSISVSPLQQISYSVGTGGSGIVSGTGLSGEDSWILINGSLGATASGGAGGAVSDPTLQNGGAGGDDGGGGGAGNPGGTGGAAGQGSPGQNGENSDFAVGGDGGRGGDGTSSDINPQLSGQIGTGGSGGIASGSIPPVSGGGGGAGGVGATGTAGGNGASARGANAGGFGGQGYGAGGGSGGTPAAGGNGAPGVIVLDFF